MKIYKFFCIMTCALFLSTKAWGYYNTIPTDISQKSKPATIKILLTKLAREVHIEATGRYLVYNPKNSILIGSGFYGNNDKVTFSEIGLNWGGVFPGSFEFRLVPADENCAIYVNGIQFKGCLDVYGIEGTINVINEIDVESFLKSSLFNEVSHELKSETLDAVTIVARTNLYYLISKNPEVTWHVEAKTIGYRGYSPSAQSQYIEYAVNRTKYMILTYNKMPFASTWSKNSCGNTVSYSSIFRKGGQTPLGVSDLPSHIDREKHRWTFKITKSSLAELFQLNKVATIDLYQVSNSNKVYGIRLSDTAESKDIDFFSLQKTLGKTNLLSNDFTVKVEGEQLTFSGFGEGIGTGLCLTSAEFLAKKNENAKKILLQAFPDTQLIYSRDLLLNQGIINEKTDPIWR